MKFKGSFLKVFSGGMIFGAAITTGYTYYKPSIVTLHVQNSPKFGFDFIQSLISKDQMLNDAIAVESTKSSTQYGKEFYNEIGQEGRRSIIAHPYDKQGSGVSITLTYLDASTGKIKIMLMEKLKVRNKQEGGFTLQYETIGGYTHGAGVEGTKKTVQSFAEEEARDAAEDLNTETGMPITLSAASGLAPQKPAAHSYTSKKDLEALGKAITQFYLKAVREDPYIKNFDPIAVKNYLKSQNVEYSRDYNAIDTVIREFREETGYNGIITPSMLMEAYTTDNYGTDNVPNLHTKCSHYIINLGALSKEPTIYQSSFKGVREIDSFQANSTEIGRLTWVSTTQLELNNSSLIFNEKSIRHSYIPVLNNIIRILRDKELQEESDGVIHSRAHISDLAKHFRLQQKLGALEGEFGEQPHKYHQIDKCIGRNLKGGSSIINSESLSHLFDKCHKDHEWNNYVLGRSVEESEWYN